MPVSEKYDRALRSRLAAFYRRAPELLRLGAQDVQGEWVWEISPGSRALGDSVRHLGLPAAFVAEVNALAQGLVDESAEGLEGINLPLSQARELLTTAAGALQAAAAMTQLTSTGSETVRRASLGSIARAAVENSVRVVWVLEGNNREERIKRAVLVELKSIDQLLRYLPQARLTRNDQDLLSARDVFVRLVKDELDLEVELHESPTIGGLQLPNISKEIGRVLTDDSYVELSTFAHPNSFQASVTSSWSSGSNGQYVIVPESSVHTEARLVRPALLAFEKAVGAVSDYIGQEEDGRIERWVESCMELWNDWCSRNGCLQ